MGLEHLLDSDELVLHHIRSAHFSFSNSFFELYITDRKIFYNKSTGSRRHRKRVMGYTNLSSIKKITFTARPDTDVGRIEILTERFENLLSWSRSFQKQPTRLVLKNVPNISYYQKIIESILFEYGRIRERWNQALDELDFHGPPSIKISSKELEKAQFIISKNQKSLRSLFKIVIILDVVALLIIPFVTTFFTLIFLPASFWQSYSRPFWKLVMFIYMTVFSTIALFESQASLIALCVPFGINRARRKRIRNRFTPQYREMIVGPDQIIFHRIDKGLPVNIPYNNEMMLEFFRKYPNNTIGIRESLHHQNMIHFGPVVDFPKVHELVFCYLLIWKRENGFLLSNAEILDYSRDFAPLKEKVERKLIKTQKSVKYSMIIGLSSVAIAIMIAFAMGIMLFILSGL